MAVEGKSMGKEVQPQSTRIELMRPTQAAVGFLEVELKARELAGLASQDGMLMSYLEQRPIPAVKGPDGRMYLTDKHHMGLALSRLASEWDHGDFGAGFNPYRFCFFTIERDFSDEKTWSLTTFLRHLESMGLCHPFDGEGRRARRLPESLMGLDDDPFRSLAGLARKFGAFDKIKMPYLEFKWADFLRARMDESRVALPTLPWAVEEALRHSKSKEAGGLPGFRGADDCLSWPIDRIAKNLAGRNGLSNEEVSKLGWPG